MLPMDPARLVEKMAPLVRAVRIDRMHEIEASRHLYEAAGRLDALEDSFFARLEHALRAGFAARGVIVDELDDIGGLVGLA